MVEKITKSRVKVSSDFRKNLIIDRYDTIFDTMSGRKINMIRIENSEDALTWNVFRTLRQINPDLWLNKLFNVSFGKDIQNHPRIVNIILWSTISPPPARRLNVTDTGELILKDEDDSEIDIIIETESFAWFIEAKYKSDIIEKTTNDPNRNQIIRNIDVGSWYAGVKTFYFTLLYKDAKYSPNGIALIKEYASSKEKVLNLLPYRADCLNNLMGIGSSTWLDVIDILKHCGKYGDAFEKYLVDQALTWLKAHRHIQH